MTSKKPKAAFFNSNGSGLSSVWPDSRVREVRSRCELYPEPVHQGNWEVHCDRLQNVEVGFSTWGMPNFSEDQIDYMPNLKAVFYAAGSVQGFARPFLNRDVKVFSAWVANGIPVAEFALSQILLSCKNYFRNIRECREDPKRSVHRTASIGPGVYGNSVALIGFGVIARHLAEFLKPFSLEVMVVDPFVSEEDLAAKGLKKVSLEEAFQKAYVVSNHLPNIPSTVEMIQGSHFQSMRESATFINTGRGRQIKQDGMIEALTRRPDLTALLDVTFPEPPPVDSPLYTLSNVRLSTHIAGSIGNEVVRMADFMIDEFDRWHAGEPTRYGVTLEMLETMA